MRLIDADALLISMMLIAPGETKKYCYPCREILKEIDDAPTIEPQRTGKWIRKWITDEERGANGLYAACSACDELIYITGGFKFCPNCGAKME